MNDTDSFDLSLFGKTTHNPSFSSLTNNFESVGKLKDYCIPVNSYFPPNRTMDALYKKIPYALKYYPGSNNSICENIAQFSNIRKPETIVAGNGSTEIISWLNSIFIRYSLFVPVPSFGRWIEEPEALGIKLYTIKYQDDQKQHLKKQDYVDAVKESGARNAVICNPNNPTGSIFSRDEILWIIEQLQHLDNIIIDESFIDFSAVEPPSIKNDVANYDNVWVLKSLGKNLGLHGLRMGFAVSNEKNISKMRRHLPYWNINGITEVLLSTIKNEQEEYQISRLKTIYDSQYLAEQFSRLKAFDTFPSNSNFIFAKLDAAYDGTELRDRILQNHSCLIRNCSNKLGSTKQYFRIAGRPQQDVDRLVQAISQELLDMKRTKGGEQGIPQLTEALPEPVARRESPIPMPRVHISSKRV